MNIINRKFGRLVIIEQVKENIPKKSGKYYSCLCDCGKTCIVREYKLINHITQSCGCYRSDSTIKRFTTHNMSETVEYKTWRAMKDRCYNMNNSSYMNYGGRGITVCESWLHSFTEFLRDMGPRPGEEYSIERIDNNGDYTPTNCKWATTSEQQRNTINTRFITYNNVTRSMIEWSVELGIPYSALEHRINRSNWTIDRAFTTPIG